MTFLAFLCYVTASAGADHPPASGRRAGAYIDTTPRAETLLFGGWTRARWK